MQISVGDASQQVGTHIECQVDIQRRLGAQGGRGHVVTGEVFLCEHWIGVPGPVAGLDGRGLGGEVPHDHRRVVDGVQHEEPGLTSAPDLGEAPHGGFAPVRNGLGTRGHEARTLETNAGGELGDVSRDQVREARAQSRSGTWKRRNQTSTH